MQYLGIRQQIARNNTKSILFLLAFPLLILVGVYVVLYVLSEQYTISFDNTYRSYRGSDMVLYFLFFPYSDDTECDSLSSFGKKREYASV